MYISITKQHMGSNFSSSAADFVNYLEKENANRLPDQKEAFFDLTRDSVSPGTVIQEIDANTTKLKRAEPKFYSITINPSKRELQHINNDPLRLKQYVKAVIKDYAAAFNRNPKVREDQIKFFAKIEFQRNYKGFDHEVQANSHYIKQIVKLENDLVKIRSGQLNVNSANIQKEIASLKAKIPFTLDGHPIVQGMKKPGPQTHVHIIVSRKDTTNTYSLSPGSKYIKSEASLNGRFVQRGFHRDQFFSDAEKTFDRMFGYKRNFVETYQGRKSYLNDPKTYYATLLGLPKNERSAAFRILRKTGVGIPSINIPKSKVDLALKTLKQFKKAMQLARSSSSIGY